MKGLRVTCIKSERPMPWLELKTNKIKYTQVNFTRYQLWEHELIYQQEDRPFFWMPGKIIHHLRTWAEAHEYFKALSPQYESHEIEI